MANFSQSGSWNSGGNDHLTAQCNMANPQGNQGDPLCCLCDSTSHTSLNCPIWKRMQEQYSGNREGSTPFNNPTASEPNLQGNIWNSQGYNQWDNQCTSFPGPQLDPSSHQGNFHWNDNASQIIGQQVADLQAKLEELMASLSSKTSLIIARAEQHDKEIDQQAERLSAMEQAQSKSDEIIKAQTERITSLEETVKTLETRLKKQQNEQSHQCAANLRRIKQMHIEIPTLRQGLRSTDSGLSHVRNEQSAINCVVKKMLTRNESYTGVPNPNKTSSSCTLEPSRGVYYDSDSSDAEDEFQASCEQLWGHIGSHLDGEKNQQLKENAQKEMDSTSTPAPQVLNKEKENSNQECRQMRIGKITVIESSTGRLREELKAETSISVPENSGISVTPPNSTSGTSTSCDGCGLNCTHQLRACVYMIQTMPSLRKVKEEEINKMKSKHKKKLQRKWVPRGTFDIKRMCRIDSILSELKCIHQVLPRVKKRQKKPPDFNDSHD